VLLAATVTKQTPLVTNAQGWLYELLRLAGLQPERASEVQGLLVKPVAVVVVLVVGFVVARLGARVVGRVVAGAARRTATRTAPARAEARATTLAALAGHVFRGVVLVVAVLAALQAAGLDLTPVVAGATVVGAALAFGAQSLVRDLLAGFLLSVEDQFGIGDVITVGETTGLVEAMTLRVTTLRGEDGALVFVPNGEIRVLVRHGPRPREATAREPSEASPAP
jgi:small-conductance mechanosensitive channel